MLTTMRQIGNSRGVLIPAAFLASCQIEDQVDMELRDGQIIIKPIKRALREGWFANASQENLALSTKEAIAMQVWANLNLADDSEWVW